MLRPGYSPYVTFARYSRLYKPISWSDLSLSVFHATHSLLYHNTILSHPLPAVILLSNNITPPSSIPRSGLCDVTADAGTS